jgi:uncharacterized membrane-anchored protein YitT (DUF2179 family)
VNHLKTIMPQIDPQVFMIVMPAKEVFGCGFQPLSHQPAA